MISETRAGAKPRRTSALQTRCRRRCRGVPALEAQSLANARSRDFSSPDESASASAAAMVSAEKPRADSSRSIRARPYRPLLARTTDLAAPRSSRRPCRLRRSMASRADALENPRFSRSRASSSPPRARTVSRRTALSYAVEESEGSGGFLRGFVLRLTPHASRLTRVSAFRAAASKSRTATLPTPSD